MLTTIERATSTSILHTVKDISRSSGGLATSVYQLSQSLASKYSNLSIELVASPGETPLPHAITLPKNYRWTPVLQNQSKSTELIVRGLIQECLAKSSPCLIHDHGLWLLRNHHIAVEARRLKIPRVVSVHGMLEPWALEHKAWKKKLAWLFYQRSDLHTAQVLHATSESEASNLKKLLPKIPVALIPWGVNLPKISNKSSNNFELDSFSRSKTILFLGRFHPVKGLENLIEAWHHTKPASWKLLLVGPDENNYRSFLEQKVNQLGLTSSIGFRNAVEGQEKQELYQAADVVVLPSMTENFGIVVAEALSYGIPVITTKGAPWSDLETHHCGWWIDIGVSPLVAALRTAINMSPQELNTMGARGKSLIESKYTWENTVEKMLQLYEWLLYQTASVPEFIVY